jgi:hypothetical protein
MLRTAYRFFDASFTLESDSAAFTAEFDQAYGAFKAAEQGDDPVYRVTLNGESGSPDESGGPSPSAVTIGGETWRSPDPEALSLYAYNAVLNAISARVRSHYLIHAAALVTPDGSGRIDAGRIQAGVIQAGVILAGASGRGKTTLTLALAGQGWRVFSDDVAALSRSDGQLYPFPRPLAVRLPGGAPGEKRWVDIDEIAPQGSHAIASCPARFLFILTSQADAAVGSAWYLMPDRLTVGLLAGLRGVTGVVDVQAIAGQRYPVLRATFAAGAWPGIEPELLAVCRRHDVLLFEITRGPEDPPDFEAAPELSPLAPSEAAQALLGNLKGGPRSALLCEEFGGSAARLYLALAALAAGMTCYRLRVGRLDEMVTAISGVVEG